MSPSKLHEWVNANSKRASVYAQESLIVDAAEEIWAALAEEKMTKADLAARLGKSKAFITQLLNGSRNMTLRTLADVASALGRRTCILLRPQYESDAWESIEAAFVGGRPVVSSLEFESSNEPNWRDVSPVRAKAA
jgi:transcriptional regulator with XRE-family HTH domain